ncbi:hypothetical protein FRB90_005353 [Tulasnella sp. 427]|nr:hypothetical protein FRB90_005353 [Tulasnella sp. 427]
MEIAHLFIQPPGPLPHPQADLTITDPISERFSLAHLVPECLPLCTQCVYWVSISDLYGHRRSVQKDYTLTGDTLNQVKDWCRARLIRENYIEYFAETPSGNQPPIPFLPIHEGFACPIEVRLRTGQSKREIQEHVAKDHSGTQAVPIECLHQCVSAPRKGGYRRVTRPQPEDIHPPPPLAAAWSVEFETKKSLGWAQVIGNKSRTEIDATKEKTIIPDGLSKAMTRFMKKLKQLSKMEAYEARCLLNSEGHRENMLRKAHGDLAIWSTCEPYTRAREVRSKLAANLAESGSYLPKFLWVAEEKSCSYFGGCKIYVHELSSLVKCLVRHGGTYKHSDSVARNARAS